RHTRFSRDWSSDVCSSDLEKQLVAVQATLDGEAAERTRLAKDLHDGLGSMLSLVKFNLPQVTGEAAVLESIDVSRFRKAIGMLEIGRASCRERVWVADVAE